MMGALKEWKDRFLGRGDASITVPVFDGALKSNQVLEDAEVFAQLEAPADLASDGRSLFVADGQRVLRFDPDASGRIDREGAESARFEQSVTALACIPGVGLALALDGREVRIVGGAHDGRRWNNVAGKALVAVNAIGVAGDGRLVVTDASQTHSTEHWKNDLMDLGHSGRLLELDLAGDGSREIAGSLAYAFGACAGGHAPDAGMLVSESWRHRVLRCRPGHRPEVVIDGLPGYPSRIMPAAGGGFWLTCFLLRTQLVEFVLREPVFRKRMIREIEPRYWIAPELTSGNTFLEPMQGAHLKMMGVVKPWAPPRSYGLVIRLSPEGLVRYSFHSRFDGKHHGIVAAVECGGDLYALSKGRGRVLRIPIAAVEAELGA